MLGTRAGLDSTRACFDASSQNPTATRLHTRACHMTVYYIDDASEISMGVYRNTALKHRACIGTRPWTQVCKTRVYLETNYEHSTQLCKDAHGRVSAGSQLSKLINLVSSSPFYSIDSRLFCTSSLAISFILLALDLMIGPPS